MLHNILKVLKRGVQAVLVVVMIGIIQSLIVIGKAGIGVSLEFVEAGIANVNAYSQTVEDSSADK